MTSRTWIVDDRERRHYRGKRARRQAFYQRRRLQRAVRRLITCHDWAGDGDRDDMFDAVVYGLSAFRMIDGTIQRIAPQAIYWDRADGRGFTDEPLREEEWPRAMKCTWSIKT